jgi:hypothetical protein
MNDSPLLLSIAQEFVLKHSISHVANLPLNLKDFISSLPSLHDPVIHRRFQSIYRISEI